jgi:DNA helicase HerA-like ATPase
MKLSDDIEQLCKKLKPVIGDQAEKLWYFYLAEDDRGRKDIALDIEIISEKLLKREALTKQPILLDPPPVNNSHGKFLIGDVIYKDQKLHPLHLKDEDFIKQIGIFAISGEGKTNLAYLLALQLLKQKIPFLAIDWKRSWRNLLSLRDSIPELEQVQVYTIGRDTLPFIWNPFRSPPGSDNGLWISTIAEALEKSHLSGPGVAYYFNKIYQNILSYLSPAKNNFYPNFFDGLKNIENIKVFGRELQWKQTALRIFQSFTIGSSSKAFNSRNPIKLENLLDKPVIFELDLEMPKPLRIFFSEIILRWIHLYRLNQGETENFRHALFLEEAHNLFNEPGPYRTFQRESNSLENIYREIRAFGQGIVSITQHPSLLPIYLLGNCHTQIYLGLQHEDDIRAARKSLFLPYSEEPYPNMLKVGECIIKIKNRVDPCLVKIPLVPVKKGITTDEWLKLNVHTYLHLSHEGKRHQKAGYLPSDKDNNGKSGKHPHNTTSPRHRFLLDIFENPFSSTTQRYKRLKLNPKYGNKYKNWLISEGYVKARNITTGKGWITLFDLTPKGRMTLRDLGSEVKDTREGIVHRYWKEKIAEFYRAQGLKVLVEENINGRPDIIVINGDKRAAIEIETGKSNIIENIQRDLKADFDEVICVATDRYLEEKIMNSINQRSIIDDRVKVTSVLGFGIC